MTASNDIAEPRRVLLFSGPYAVLDSRHSSIVVIIDFMIIVLLRSIHPYNGTENIS